MFNDPRWADLKRLVWHRDGGRCQMCKREGIEAGIQDGYIRSGFACHHIVPFESAKTTAEMERLFFDANNIMLVCRECHAKILLECNTVTEVINLLCDAEVIARMDDENRREFESTTRTDSGKAYQYGARTKAHGHRTPDSVAMDQRIRFEEYDRAVAEGEAHSVKSYRAKKGGTADDTR